MKTERRNYYRILHVQPEAPAAVITASYRSLMSTLRHHPDLGGDHETAALINRAYAVLSDPERRRAYDRTLARGRGRTLPIAPSTAPAPIAPAAGICPFCQGAVGAVVDVTSRCPRCQAPLAPVARSAGAHREMLGRRSGQRVDRAGYALLHAHWQRPAVPARLRDLSPTGISVITAAPVAIGAVVRVVDANYDVVARVVQVRASDPLRIVHAALLTAWFAERSAVFVSMRV